MFKSATGIKLVSIISATLLLAGVLFLMPTVSNAFTEAPCSGCMSYDQFLNMQNGSGALPPVPPAFFDYYGGGGGGGGGGSYPVPQCTLDLNKDVITWTSTDAESVTIVPTTNSPQIPTTVGTPITSVVFTGDFWNSFQATHFSKWKTDAQTNGGVTLASSDGFYGDKLTADRLCAVTFPGSVSGSYQTDSYSSSDNNMVARWNGSSWQRAGAKTWPNTHFRYTISCVKTETTYSLPLSGSYGFSPALGTGTHSYHLTASGYGGSATCDASITIAPPSAPTCDSFSANTNPIDPGYSTTLSWQTSNATSVSIDQGIGAVAVDDSKLVSPSQTTTYTLTATGPGGSIQCSTKVKVNPPPPPPPPQMGCINILKETFDPTGTKLSPVAQFTFKLDGTTLAYNDANGNASFTNVTPGTHTVTEIVPNTWEMLSVTPANGTVVVAPGAQCAGVVFKNRQVLPPPPPPSGECKLSITKAVDKTQVGMNEVFEYTINFKNIGNANCTGGGVKVYDKIDSKTTYVSETHSSNVTGGYGSNPVYSSSSHELYWNADTLTPGETGWVKWKGKVKQLGSCSADIFNKAKITSKEYNNFQTWVSSNEVVVTAIEGCTPPPPPPECEMVITKSVDKTKVGKNEVFEYTINFENTGDADCTGGGVKVVDVVDSQITYISETHSSGVNGGYGGDPVYKSSDHTLRWNANTLTPGEKGWVKWKGKVTTLDQCSIEVPNKAKITSKEYNNFQTWVVSNEVRVVVEKDCTPPPPTECKLIITKSVNKTEVEKGEQFEYTINFENTGDSDCTGGGVKVYDVIDSRTTYVSETHSSNVTGGYGSDPVYKSSDHTLRWNAATLTPGEKGWVKWKGKVTTLTECSIEVPNAAKITAKEYNNFQTWVTSNKVDVKVSKDCTTPNVPVCTLSANPTTINAASGTSELRWTTTNATEFALDHGIGTSTPVALGTKEVTVSSTTTYHGLAIGPGGVARCEATITVVPPQNPTPACTLSVSPTSIRSGESVTVSWTSSNVNQGFINGNVGTTSPVSSGSVGNIFPSDDFAYVGTFTGPYGNVTCSAPVDVTTGPGCAPGLCPGGMNQPSVSLFRQPGEQPLAAFVYLAQIPYTGFEAGAALTAIFWMAVALFAFLLTYFLMGRGSIKYVLSYAFGLAGIPTADVVKENGARDTREYGVEYPTFQPAVHSGTQYAESTMAAPVQYTPVAYAPIVSAPVVPVSQNVEPIVAPKVTDGVPSLTDVIESRAHAAGVLISPEAVAAAAKLSPDRAEALVIFGEVLNRAIQTIPREDGWVMLTSDRFETVRDAVLAKKNVSGAVAPVSSPAPAASTAIVPKVYELRSASVAAPLRDVQPASATESAASQFAGAVLSGDRDTAFGIIRSLETDNLSPLSLMAGTAAVLDRIYRLRKGGKNGVDPVLLEKSSSVEDETLARLVEIFAHSLDQAYTNPFTGVKLALAQAFDA